MGNFVDPAPTTRREVDQGDPSIHYTVEIRVQKVEKVANRSTMAHAQAQTTERVITELGHIVLSEKVLYSLLKKGAKALELIGE